MAKIELLTKAQEHDYIKEAVDFMVEVIKDFGTKRIAVSFNGGKDCTVALHILNLAITQMNQSQTKIEQ